MNARAAAERTLNWHPEEQALLDLYDRLLSGTRSGG
jgi:hypothetical protein